MQFSELAMVIGG